MQQLEALLADFNSKYFSSIEELTANAEKMKVACERIRDSWSGSCIGYHSKLYYGNFEKPPKDEKFSVEWGDINGLSEAWRERTAEEVKTAIARLIGNNFSVDAFEKDTKRLAVEIEDFEMQIGLLVASIATNSVTHPLADFEKIEPDNYIQAYIEGSIPQKVMTRDNEALAQGIIVPAIIYYQALVHEARSVVSNIRQFVKGCRHFMKWYELQAATCTNSRPQYPLMDLSLLYADILS